MPHAIACFPFYKNHKLRIMKSLSILAVLFFGLFSANNSFAQSTVKDETIKVWGNCGMCKTTIEKAATKAGATTANWDEESKELKISYAVNKTSSEKIQKQIAKAGYDTQGFKATDKAYDKLHGCCKYERGDATAAKACCAAETCAKGDDCKAKDCCKDMSCCKM
jgi:hypothetical protein